MTVPAAFYGLGFKRGKALCPFHADTHPSMSFKYNRFNCFTCGARGSVIDLTQQLLGLTTSLEAVKRLNMGFNLGLKVDGKPDPQAVKLQEQRVKLAKAFEAWENQAYIKLAHTHRQLLGWRIEFAPKSTGETLHPKFVISLQNLEYIESLCETLRLGTLSEKIEIYREMDGKNLAEH